MKRFIVMLALTLSVATGFAQEICNNGKDDDGDGFIDCYDNACSSSTFCKDFFLGEVAQCNVTPPAFPQFTMAMDFSSPNETTNHLARVAIGDLNRDGIPEIVTMNRYTKKLFILNGSDGSIQKQANATINIGGSNVNWDPNWEVAIANINNDACGEIYFFGWMNPPGNGDDDRGYYIFAYDCNLNYIWHTAERFFDDPINYGLADFNGDGKAELYVKDAIYDAHTGTRLIKSSATTDSEWRRINGGPVAVDMTGDTQLELVIGLSIYTVNLGDGTADNGSLTLFKRNSSYFVRNSYNATSVADYNLDGNLDILASGSTVKNGDNTTVFFWDVTNDVVKTYIDKIPDDIKVFDCNTNPTGKFYANGWRNGTGRLNIADLDGDGNLNVSYVSGKFLYALDHNLQPLSWSPKVVNEETSGHTGCTLFDFNGDGKSEIVYRDEKFLYIINGIDGTTYNQKACVSRTNREYPIVADLDADGQTEICVTCGYDDVASDANFCDLGYSRYSHVRVFKTDSDPWVPARRVWNQHGYFNVNINDDLTLPINQQKHHLVFSTGSCTQGPNRPLNSFLNQTPFLNIDGCPSYKSPDLAFVENSLTVNPPTCPTKDFTVSFQFTNVGDNGLSGDLPITFYSGDPTKTGAIKLNTVTITLNSFKVDDVFSVSNATVNGLGNPFTLYIVLNDNGSTVPTPISLPNTNFLECDYGNNIISAPVNPNPVSISAEKIQDNIKCIGSSSTDNGAARAFIPEPGNVKNTTDYNFYWSAGTVAKPVPADKTGSTVNTLATSKYTVYAVHKTANCSSNTAEVTIGQTDRTVKVTVKELAPNTNCQTNNGSLIAIVNADPNGVGEPAGNFDFEWYEGSGLNNPKVSLTADATGLKPDPITYTVVVTDKATGCQSSETGKVKNQTTKPAVTTSATDIVCSSANSGTVSATVNNGTSGFTFNWYNGKSVKPSPDFTGSTYSNRTAGTYTVVAIDNTTMCKSDAKQQPVTKTAPITVTVNNVNQQTSCDPTKPNGSASAKVGNQTNGFTFEWFKGQNTNPAKKFASTADVTGLAVGVYTVKATSADGCTDTEEVTINNAIVTPSLTIGAVGDLTDCRTPNGSITVNVTPDSPSDYTFFWYEGSVVKATPDFADTDNVLQNLEIGTYTVKAVHNTKFCNASPIKASVEDNTPTILISQKGEITLLPTSCDANNGRMGVEVSAPGNTMGFLIEWFKNAETTAFASVSGVTSSDQNSLATAMYTVQATNLNNGCFARDSYPLPVAEKHILELVASTDPTTCSPQNDGSLTVKLEPSHTEIQGEPAGTLFSVNDYELNFYEGKDDTGTLIETRAGSAGVLNGDVKQTANYLLSNLEPGFYTVVAIENHPQLSDCKSVPITVEIKPYGIPPVVSLASVPVNNTNCEGTTANGEITVSISESSDAPGSPARNPLDYNITWSPAISTGVTATNVSGGTYTVSVVNKTTLCPSDPQSIEIFDFTPVVSVTEDADLIVTDIIMCSKPNGASATVVSVNGTALQSPPEYSFSWFDAAGTAWPTPATPATTSSIIDLTAGTYYVEVTKITGNTGLNCKSGPVEFVVEDLTPGTVLFDLESFMNPTRCKQPANDVGFLTVTSQTNYQYEWYAGADDTGTAMTGETANSLNDITIPNGETEANYTVKVTNTDNDCSATSTYKLLLEVAPIGITVSGSPLTSCSSNDGSLFGTVTTGNSFGYTYNWYIGSTVGTTPDFPQGKQVDNLPNGTYTLVAIDNADTFCESAPVQVSIADERVYPVVTASALEPLTMCDPNSPDGVASASVDGDIVNYNFDWYAGAPSGTPIFRGSEASNLTDITYSVIAGSIVSGCSDTTTVTILRQTLPVPTPQVQLISNVTACDANNQSAKNGALGASVDGNTSGYIFHWYNANPGVVVDTATFASKGEIYNNLDVGTYYVSATDRVTGCISGPANGSIIFNPILPDFEFIVDNASCKVYNVNPDGSNDTDGTPDGVVSLSLLGNVEIGSIEWDVNGTKVLGPILANVEAGVYSVRVTSAMGCHTDKTVEVKTEINPFNGVSRNGDGLNDIFYINCIENFPDNHVKIFNRAGTLVYEANGYNNSDVFFDGISNKGVSLMGTNLPDGTYFYIIDKRDGSKPMAGYLEIVK